MFAAATKWPSDARQPRTKPLKNGSLSMHQARNAIFGVGALLVFVLIGVLLWHAAQPSDQSALSQHPTPLAAPAVQWTPLASPNSGAGNNELSGIASVDAKDVWASGFYQ